MFTKIKTYPFESVMMVLSVVAGIYLFLIPNAHLYEIMVGVTFVLSSTLGFMGIFWKGHNIDSEWLLIRIGLVSQIFFWLAFGIASRFEGVIFSIFCLILFIRLVIRERLARLEIGK